MPDAASRAFGQAVRVCFEKYVVFSGRAPRAEFWYWTLFTVLAQLAVDLLAFLLDGRVWKGPFNDIASLLELAFLLPGVAVQLRRMHDLDKSGWWTLIALIPLFGWIVLLVWMCTRGTAGSNRFGADPLNSWQPSR